MVMVLQLNDERTFFYLLHYFDFAAEMFFIFNVYSQNKLFFQTGPDRGVKVVFRMQHVAFCKRLQTNGVCNAFLMKAN